MKTLSLLILLCAAQLSAANRYFVNGGTNNNYGTSGNWSTTDNGAGGAGVPTSADAVFFTANSPDCTVDTTTRSALSLDFTGYTRVITLNAALQVSGNITLSAGMGNAAGTSALTPIATSTLTSNGKPWTAPLTFPNLVTYTLADIWTVSGLLTFGATSASPTINGFQLTATGSVTFANTTGNINGTTLLLMNGTGTMTSSMTTGVMKLPWTINTAGTITFTAGNLNYNTGTFTYTAGTIVGASGIAFSVPSTSGGNTTLAVGGITWGSVVLNGAFTYTLNDTLNSVGLVTVGSTVASTVINGSKINCAAGLRYAGTTGTISGTTVFNLTGTGSVDAPSITTGKVLNPITLAAGSGTITVSGLFPIDFSKLKVTSGTVITDTGPWASGTTHLKGHTFQ